ncbi:hypothetical protein B0H13DRAFT_1876980 [Mycena leptocephala]|nr:hypothetical protein B0H13DRAFT_1876980 [Mycena leptocephala]
MEVLKQLKFRSLFFTSIFSETVTVLDLVTAIHLAQMNPAHLILAVCDIKKQTQRKCNQDSIIAQTKFTGLLEVWELYMPDFSVKQFVERTNTTLERWDAVIVIAGINNARLKFPCIQQSVALKVRVDKYYG